MKSVFCDDLRWTMKLMTREIWCCDAEWQPGIGANGNTETVAHLSDPNYGVDNKTTRAQNHGIEHKNLRDHDTC